ncbi:MAG TPA: FMN-binding protein [Trebonia sp.]|nr:FMN-binding protein [Trebonia sp.]
MRRVILAIVCTAAGLALLLSFKTRSTPGLASSTTIPPSQNGTASSSAGSPTATSGSAGSSGRNSASSTSSTASKTVAGDVASTIYGPIQVTITVKGGKITAVTVPEYPDGTPRDQQINAFALPELIQETVAADSARVDSVSGATYTSQGYVTSLQSAIDKAGL